MNVVKLISDSTKITSIITFLQLVFYISLCMVYPRIARDFAYMGFVNEFNVFRFIIMGGLVLFLLFIGKFIKRDFIYAVWNIYLSYTLFPCAIGYYTGLCGLTIVLIHLIFLFMLFLFSRKKMQQIKFYSFSISNNRNYIFLWGIVLLLILPFLLYLPYINPRNLLFEDLYETRFLFRSISINRLNYLINPLVRVMIPILFIVSIHKKQYFAAILSLILVLYLFLCGAFRSHFVGIIAVIFFYIGSFKFKPVIFLSSMIFIILLGSIFTDFSYVIDVGIRRLLFVPIHLEDVYYQTFNHNFLYWSHNPIGSIFYNYPYDRDLTMYVGEVVIGKPGMNANVGFLIEGFFSAGYVGVILISFVLSLVYSFIDSLDINPIFFGIVIVYIFVSVNSLFLSALVTHGLFCFILMSYFFLKRTDVL